VAAREEQRAVARGRTAEGVARAVADQVGLGLDDAPADPTLGQVVNQGLADQEAGERDRVDRQLGPGQPADRPRYRAQPKRPVT
jgi:hypothetical protein